MTISTIPGYEICHLNQANHLHIAAKEAAKYAVSLSGGLASAVSAERVIQRYGRDQVLLWFADTLYEDDDLYRFLRDCMQRWGGTLYWYTDGRTPLEVAAQKKLIPCNLAAPCSYELKVKPFRQFILAMPSLPVVYIGLDRWEKRRLISVKESYAKAIPDVLVDYPLLWESYEVRPLTDVCRQDWQIEPPRLYSLGFSHNNCGGRCVRQGIREWIRLGTHFPERYQACEEWEQEQRAQGGARAKRSFCAVQRRGRKQSLPLADIRAQYFDQRQTLF
ncbi:hypothetical protein [Dictyobacter formicarum]|uniref:Phosphoadenosine phosphosulphate reductase domain-containing protein n=1 Tax=Dictyobacter formicarum TaxID=2778368 RepID=A0ABQ3VB29_9CHLR|nr:hypothetical protein [Dictyobacter formicarum]GHO82995.1 hypothetical protein KSZ_10010 [Dictyobacter formicarum]